MLDVKDITSLVKVFGAKFDLLTNVVRGGRSSVFVVLWNLLLFVFVRFLVSM